MNGCICEKLCRVLCWNNFRTCPSSLRSIQEGATCVSVSANRDASARSLLPEGTRLLSFSKQPAEQARAEECVCEREGERERKKEEGRGTGASLVYGARPPCVPHRKTFRRGVLTSCQRGDQRLRANERRQDGTL